MKQTIAPAFFVLLLVAAHPRAQAPPRPSPAPATEVKGAFLKLLDRPHVPLDARTIGTRPSHREVVSERVDFAVEARADGTIERVPALVARPEKGQGRMPAVVLLHGTGGSKEGMWTWMEQLAHRGVLTIAIDGRHHGDRAGGSKGAEAYNRAIIRAWRTKSGEPQPHPFYFDTCWDAMRTVDYLMTRPDVDSDRIGMLGISKGGIETWLTSAVDDRIKVVVPAISMQSFRWGLDHDRWQGRANTIKAAHEAAAADLGRPVVDRETCLELWSKLIPGILDEFDGPSMVRLLAGRPTLILNGETDPNCPIEGAELAFNAARAAFAAVDAADHLKIDVAKGSGHTLTHDQHVAALDWLVAWLKPVAPEGAARYLHHRPRALAGADPAARRGPTPAQPEHPRPSRRPYGRRPGPAAATEPTR